MPLQNASIKNGATFTTVGGVDVVLSTDGLQVVNGVHLVDAATADFRVRPNITARTKNPTLLADGTYGKGRRSMTITIPKILANGKQGFPCFRLELEDFPEMTAAEVAKLRNWAVLVLTDSDFDSYWNTGSLS